MRSCNTTNNVIKNCDVAVHTWHMSSPNLGHGPYRLRPWLDVSYDLLGYNYIYSNEVNFHNQGSTIYAIGNNWSGSECSFNSPFDFDEEPVENVLWDPVLAELVPALEIANIEELYHKASKLEAIGEFEAALDLYTQVILAVPNEKPGELALYGMARCYKALNQEDAMILALVSISEQFEGTGVHKHAHSLLSSHKIKDGELAMLLEAEGHIHTIRTEYPNNEMEPKLLYEEFLIAKKRGTNPLGRAIPGSHVSLGTAEVYRKLKENYPDSPFTFLAGLGSANSKKTKTTAAVPTSFTLYPAYPNPFNPVTTIRFDIPVGVIHELPLQLRIYDITGRMVETLLNKPLASGTHEITWNAESSSTGVYFIVLTSGNERQVQKVVLMK
ncbi:MAG: T9SS type A sorting domain-containing protein [Candidatus Marinimicrobia bacterium]|nr:T9SS type A sorting domain-containing protein [Candidatus Neomarinimicrobiota bacterium]MBT4569066.1 T9SS type A sorting domain-containing protein [Candidatus Neomarinimicrobiota bacterium]MBT4796466.1 T9SS type A sorting domain-containing protein [Candidatus Neomarinimicrobiota bacterium]MBT6709158.1 T9SS type A sorting domain-containing protein [Candidatus Neomarinimicrobiota bacterium]